MTLDAQLRKNEQIVIAWNQAFPVGTRVTVRLDNHRIVPSVTTSRAELLGETPVVMVQAVRGPYLLSRIRPLIDRHSGRG